MKIQPEKCAYVGDRLNRDVESSRKAGFAKTVILRGPNHFANHQTKYPNLIADHYIDNLKELLEFFPVLQKKGSSKPVFNASLSTMWAIRNFPTLTDFFEAAERSGFAGVELNHQIDSAMLRAVQLNDYKISSVHEPCPADIPTEQLKERDWLISSPDEACRVHGVEAIKRSIDLAQSLSLPVIVVHCGMVSTDMTIEKKLRRLFESGKTDTNEYRVIKQTLIESRTRLIGPRFEAVKKSLGELFEYAGRLRIRLGLENRYHYFDIPNPDEMGELLALAGPDRLGFVYDVGHAQALDRLGFFSHEEWLQRYSSRIIEVHLHDVKGINDHFAPGLGEVDFDMVASYLPEDAIRTFELQVVNTPEQVKASLQFLAEHGCIKTV
jgi:sugar phosphate isomerase/epimerase